MIRWQDSSPTAPTTTSNPWDVSFDPWHQPQVYGSTSTVAYYEPWPEPVPELPRSRERTIFEPGRPERSGARARCRARSAPPHVRAWAPRPVRAQHR